MNSKIIRGLFIIIMALSYNLLFTAEKWNVLLVNWENMSSPRDKSIGIQIKKSIAWQLQRNINLNVIIDTNNSFYPQHIGEARIEALSNTADVIIFGNYYVEKEQIIIITEVYDILTNQIKMRKSFKGAATIDFFEVIDQMAKEISDKITELLPEISVKSEVEIKKQRATVFETEKIKIKRMFYTRLGLTTEFGQKTFEKFYYSPPATNSSASRIPFTQINFGLSIRYWDFRLDFMMTLIGMPSYNWTEKVNQFNNNLPNYFNLSVIYYLPWFNKNLALGLGFIKGDHIIGINTNKSPIEYNQPNINGDTTCLSINISFNPFDFLEVGLVIGLKGEVTGSGSYYDTGIAANVNRNTSFRFLFPPIELSVFFFFNTSIGVETRFFYAPAKYHEEIHNSLNGNLLGFDDTVDQYMIIYAGMVYKVDLLNQ